MEMHEAIAQRMRELAEERGATVTEIGAKGGIKQTTISEIMNGRSKHPKVSTIQAYCNGCNITLSEFFNSSPFKVEMHEAVAQRMRELAEERGATVTEIGARGGIKQTTISEIMNGRSKHPKINTIQDYCKGSNITLSEFFKTPTFDSISN